MYITFIPKAPNTAKHPGYLVSDAELSVSSDEIGAGLFGIRSGGATLRRAGAGVGLKSQSSLGSKSSPYVPYAYCNGYRLESGAREDKAGAVGMEVTTTLLAVFVEAQCNASNE